MQNRTITECFEKSKGKSIKYIDRDGKRKHISVKTPTDIYRIIFDTFKIN